MPPMFRFFLALLPFFFTTDGGSGGGDNNANGNGGDGRDDQTLGDAGKRALDAERLRAKTAEDDLKAVRKELDGLKKTQQDEADKKAKEQGEWQTLAEKREAALATTKTDLDAATAELAVLRDHLTKQFDAAVKDFPDVIKAFAPSADASLPDRLKWLETATAQVEKLTKDTTRGNGPDPKGKTPSVAKAESPVSMLDIMNS